MQNARRPAASRLLKARPQSFDGLNMNGSPPRFQRRLSAHPEPVEGCLDMFQQPAGIFCLLIVLLVALAGRSGQAKETFSVDYIVSISKAEPGAVRVRWELSGIEEVKYLSLRFPAGRFDHFRRTGTLQPIDGGLRWTPGNPYAHL